MSKAEQPVHIARGQSGDEECFVAGSLAANKLNRGAGDAEFIRDEFDERLVCSGINGCRGDSDF